MKRLGLVRTWSLAAIPYLLLSSSEQAGIVTHVDPDGSGERLVYARGATARAPEMSRHLQALLPASDWNRTELEAGGERTRLWRDAQLADLSRVGDVQVERTGILHSPLSLFTYHTWKETLTFDRGEATDVEVHGKGLARLTYVVRMPGTVLSHSPPGEVEGNRVEWTVAAASEPQTLTVESRSVRWGYLLLWIYVLAFVVVKAAAVAPRLARRVRRKPKRI